VDERAVRELRQRYPIRDLIHCIEPMDELVKAHRSELG